MTFVVLLKDALAGKGLRNQDGNLRRLSVMPGISYLCL
jgi:hypothetical protein